MNTITTKTTKKGLVEYLKEVAPQLTGKKLKTLADSVAYTMKKFAEDANNVLKEDLYELASEIQNAIGVPAVAPVENSLKVVKKDAPEAPAPAPSAPAKPKLGKKADPKDIDSEKAAKDLLAIANGGKKDSKTEKSGKADTPAPAPTGKKSFAPKQKPTPETDRAVILADQFPAEFKAEGVGTLKVNTDIKTMADLNKAISDGKSLMFAMYWTQRHLKQFPYDTYQINGKKFKEFPNDLDLAQLMYVSDEGRVAYAVSAYSEVIYSILPADLEMQDGMRFTNGIEYNIYEVTE